MTTTWTDQQKSTAGEGNTFLLLESGRFLLLESGGKVILVSGSGVSPWTYQQKN